MTPCVVPNEDSRMGTLFWRQLERAATPFFLRSAYQASQPVTDDGGGSVSWQNPAKAGEPKLPLKQSKAYTAINSMPFLATARLAGHQVQEQTGSQPDAGHDLI